MLKSKLVSEIRKAYLLNKYVIITPGRALRPRDIKEQTIIKPAHNCPFCPENVNRKNIIDHIGPTNNWQVLSIGNVYPAVTLNNKKAYGTQEVIIENPSHIKSLADLTEKEIVNVLKMYAQRTAAIGRNKKIEYILCFKNQGSKSGASIVHSHSQIFATNILPPDIHDELGLMQSYRIEHKTCPYCDIIKKEMKSERRIYEDDFTAAFAPYASEFHYETWIFPKRHLDNITNLNEGEIRSFASTLKNILVKLGELNLSYNFYLHQVASNRDQHLYLKIQPRDNVWGGIELGSGLIINSVPPETAAAFYRH